MIEGEEFSVNFVPSVASVPPPKVQKVPIPPVPAGKMVRIPFGRIFATRSGDKGGNANLGVWGKSPEAYAFLKEFLTTKKLKELLKDMSGYESSATSSPICSPSISISREFSAKA